MSTILTFVRHFSMWDMESALRYIRDLQPHAMERGWCILLGGGVLNRGWSAHDLDLLLYPRTTGAVVDDVLALFPKDGTWSSIGVASVYTFNKIELRGPVELILQTFVPEAASRFTWICAGPLWVHADAPCRPTNACAPSGGKHGEDR